ncbi:cation:proton antiporter [Streptacidiphilus anmyonensis]|uniref:cation:proton antiporter n=1 Tax=Streptacidiphilus anmyonensis TaxID=405782 RepID=UPI0005A8FF88|nr:cation:proton antiporter [Streptacidiphilus anmyonensis]
MTTDQILAGVGLTLVLAVGCQILAERFRFPALVALLPVGFAAGALTDVVNPQRLLGPAFSPLVSLAVAVILYDAGRALDLGRLHGHTRRVVLRLIALGVPITGGAAMGFSMLLFDMPATTAAMLGVILVVSGPTVVGPLLGFVRPKERLQHILAWEGSLIDPVGGILGAITFHAVSASTVGHPGAQVLRFFGSLGVGLAGGAVGTVAMWLLLARMRLSERLATSAQLAVVVGIAAACDAVRDDSGLIAAVVIGLAVTNLSSLRIQARNPFFETLVQQILGILFISISATITPASLRHLGWPALGLIAALVLLVRPVVALVATLRTDLGRGERSFVGWMAPRGIVAAGTASTFSASLASQGVPKAADILPVTYLVIVATVTLYAFTAEPVASWLRVRRPAASRPLLVGGEDWVVDLATVLRAAGVDVLMWAGLEEQRQRLRQTGLELLPGGLMATGIGDGGGIEGITTILLLSREDDFNALVSTLLGSQGGRVYRLAPAVEQRVRGPQADSETLFAPQLTRTEIEQRHRGGATIAAHPAGTVPSADYDLLFRIRADGALAPVTRSRAPAREEGDTEVVLGTGVTAMPVPVEGTT